MAMIRRFFRWLRRRCMWIAPAQMDQAKRDMEERIAMDDKKHQEANHER
jgi:hypothetical protein